MRHHRDQNVLTHSVPPRRSSDLHGPSFFSDGGCRWGAGISPASSGAVAATSNSPAILVAGGEYRGYRSYAGCAGVTRTAHPGGGGDFMGVGGRSEEHTSELPSLMRISYAVFCLKKNRRTA